MLNLHVHSSSTSGPNSSNFKLTWECSSSCGPALPPQLAKTAATITATALSAIRYWANATKSFFNIPRERYMFANFKLASLVPIIFTVDNLANTIFNLAKDVARSVKIRAGEALDIALNIIGDLGSIGGNVSTLAEGLAAVSVVAIEAISWSTPLLFVSLALEGIGMVYHIKAFAENLLFARALKKEAGLHKEATEFTLEDYKKGIALIEQEREAAKNFIGKQFGVDGEKLMNRLHAVETEAQEKWNSTDPAQKAEAQKLMHATMHTLKDRLVTTKLSHTVNVVATTVGIVGTILLFVPPAVPVGFALLGGTSLGSIANLVNKMVETKRFEKALQL